MLGEKAKWERPKNAVCYLEQILMALFCAVIRRDSVSLLRFPFHRYVQVFSCEISHVCHLKQPYHCFFFPFLFSNYFCSVNPRVVCIVSGCCNKTHTALFHVVFESFYRCVKAVFNAGKSSSSFFSWFI